LPTTLSPLRYPGGKTRLYDKVVGLLKENELHDVVYVEPFCGGCGLAVKLLLTGNVASIVINDINPAIYAFWHCVLNETDDLCSRVTDCSVTIDERDRQLVILRDARNHSTIDVAFATLFVNRTSISGILNAGPVGGRGQEGRDKLDARFKKRVLIDKVTAIADKRRAISLHNLDVFDFVERILPELESTRVFVNFDPPYVKKGQELYLDHFSWEDHRRLRDRVSRCRQHWIVTYDYSESVLDLYSPFKYERVRVNHSAGTMKKGDEVIIYSQTLRTN